MRTLPLYEASPHQVPRDFVWCNIDLIHHNIPALYLYYALLYYSTLEVSTYDPNSTTLINFTPTTYIFLLSRAPLDARGLVALTN